LPAEERIQIKAMAASQSHPALAEGRPNGAGDRHARRAKLCDIMTETNNGQRALAPKLGELR